MELQQSHLRRITCLVAICVSGGAILFVGIAAACEGTPPTCVEKPSATTTGATSITSSSAYLNGDVDAKGCEGGTYRFEYRKTGSPTWIPEESHFLFGSGSQSVSEWEPFLSPETVYEFRVSVTTSNGTATGSAQSFKTAAGPPPPKPSVATQAATEITNYGATLKGTVNPNGGSTAYLFEYGTSLEALTKKTAAASAGEGTSTLEVSAKVNLDPGTKYYFRISATNPGGTSQGSTLNFTTLTSPWKIKTTPNPESASDTNLFDVSCESSTSACTAVGKSTVSGADRPVAQRWNGASWSEQSPAKKSGTLPTRLFGIDCPSETRCLAAGNYQPLEGGSVLVTEIWNEGSWNVQSPPVPSESTSSEFRGIGCNSTANCTAVGSAMIGGVKTAIAERWTSPTWAASTIPLPEGAKSSQLDGVDCIWSNFCVAVGRYTDKSGVVKTLVLYWNGSWALQTPTAPAAATQAYLVDVSCTPTPNVCTAVGNYKFTFLGKELTRALVYRFTGGTTWTQQTGPSSPEGVPDMLQSVSCATETSCAVVGKSEGAGSTRPFAGTWNGSSWSVQGTPTPAGTTSSGLYGVSCRSTTCMAVGWGTNTSGVDLTLAEYRE